MMITTSPPITVAARPNSWNVFAHTNFFVMISYNNEKFKLTFRDFKEANVSLKSADSICGLWRPRGDHLVVPP
jgi:hypothetical protein